MYNEFFTINKNFQSSINLVFDIDNELKINEYIPTTDICDILKKYVKTFLGYNFDRATTLVGPYGKGKSFILLVLSYLVGDNKNKVAWSILVEKIKKIDLELYNLIIELKNKDINLLTVIVNPNYDNITQTFQLALNDSLNRVGLTDIIPSSVFNICVSLVDKWNADKKTKKEIHEKCIEMNKVSLEELKKELSVFSPKAYNIFKKIYFCINEGLEFNPLINNNIVQIYNDIVDELINKNYKGLFIVFDEFSKFIESNSENLMLDLKITQDLAELCTRKEIDKQINMCYVTHKPLVLYPAIKRYDNNVDTFKTVEGRFVEIRFNRSLDENYQLIAHAIKKSEAGVTVIENQLKVQKSFYEGILNLNILDNMNIYENLFKGCYPLNPLTVYSLIQLSEIVAQNERTLFTFLSDNDENSLKSFLKNNDKGLFNVDKIYDYFNNLFQKEETNHIRNIWYRSESLLNKLDDNVDKKIVKTLSIILMINDFYKLSPTEEIISYCLNLPIEVINERISRLIELHYLRKNILNNMLSFALSNSKYIDEKVEYLAKTKFKNINNAYYLDKINEKRFIVPRKYNTINKMTRFYSIVFMYENEFLNLFDFSNVLDNKYCDGLLINLFIKNEDVDVNSKVMSIGNNKVIVRVSNYKNHDLINSLLIRYACLLELQNEKNVDDISFEELSLLLEEMKKDIKDLIELNFNENSKCYSSLSTLNSFNDLINYVMTNNYNENVIINNELLNKKNVSSQYQKAINHVIDYLIEKRDVFEYSVTSPENSIKVAVIDSNIDNEKYRAIIDKIKVKIINSEFKKICISKIMFEFTQSPYGIRDGVLPIIFSHALSELSDNIVLYYQNKEIELESSNIVKSIFNDKYFIVVSENTKDQNKYLYNMMKLLNVKSLNNFRKDTVNLCIALNKYFIEQPQLVRSCTDKNNYLCLSNEFLLLKKIYSMYDMNYFENVYIKVKEIFKTNSFSKIYSMMEEALYIDDCIERYFEKITFSIKKVFDISLNSSVKMGVHDFLKNYANENYKLVISEKSKQILLSLKNNMSFDNRESTKTICKDVLNSYIEDWDNDFIEKLEEELLKFKEEIINAEKVENTNELILNSSCEDISPIGSLFKTNIESILDEYADSISTSEKIMILSDFIKKML